MTRREADVVVVGAGVTGLAAALATAAEGRATIVLDQHEVGHARGSSHGTSRIFRLGYADVRYVRLARQALAGWRELEAAAGTELLSAVGALDAGAAAADVARGLASCGVRHELLTGEAAAARWPITYAADELVVFQPDGGFLRADAALAALAGAAHAAGAEVREREKVDVIAPGPRGVDVHAGSRTYRAGAVVVAAGAWAGPLLASLNVSLPVVPTRETVSYFPLPAAEEIPPLIDWAATAGPGAGVPRPGQAAYGLPAPGLGLKAGLHHSGPVADAAAQGAPDPAAVRWAASWVAGRYPEADPSPLSAETCLYTNTADESFVLERHDRVIVGSACSGHGFKFAPVVGRTLSALALQASG